ncbi:unnamed protein product [Microthlaspi erraticum]|nr:unnamed protein product [Microthlaspi erraticum]CAA7052594.1 unnamed protein product [Microthlaspi erraticum]
MHAFVDREDQKRRFRGLLHEEDWRSITGFKVQLVNTEIRLTKQRKEIVLTRDTQVSNSECFNGFIPLDLIPFGDVYRSAVQDGTSFLRGGINVESVQGISTFDFHPTGHLEVEHFENIFLHPTSDDSDVELMDG